VRLEKSEKSVAQIMLRKFILIRHLLLISRFAFETVSP